MPDLAAVLRSAPAGDFAGTVYRICPARYAGSTASMRGAYLHGARYNIRGYFGALYTSLSPATARLEIARYFTVPPLGGFVEAAIGLRLNRVVNLSDRRLLRKAGIRWNQLLEPRYLVTQEIGLRAWQAGIQGLLIPSAADPASHNLTVYLDNQSPYWQVELTALSAGPGEAGRPAEN